MPMARWRGRPTERRRPVPGALACLYNPRMRWLLWLGLLSNSALATKIVILGDSLTEGYGIAKERAFPALVQKELRSRGKNVTVVNAGVSGATSASGPARLPWYLKGKPDILVVALGANDALRGLDLNVTEKNLSETIEGAQRAKVKVLLAGMKAPTNYGEDYRRRFEAMYTNLAKKHSVPLLPFLLEGVGGKPAMNLADGIHPNEKGHEAIARLLVPALEKLL